MTDRATLFNFALSVSALLLMLISLLFSLVTHSMDRRNKRFFVTMFSVLLVYVICNLISQGAQTVLMSRIGLFFESFFSSVPALLLTYYILMSAGIERRRNSFFMIIHVLWIIYFILLLITQFTTSIYYFTPDNVYHRGPLYPLLLVPAILIMLLNLMLLFRVREKLSRKQFAAILIYLLAPTAAMLVQIFFYGLYFIILGTAIAAMVMLIFVITDQMEKFVRQQEENARQKASIMVLEMRPHFVFNTMTSIYYLCKQDPAKAQQVIMDFTTYLRGNYSAIAGEKLIPFRDELEHTKAYLAVEQVRFENELFVEYDIPCTEFRIPPLTLQPIVENAVKHGIDPESEALTILIRTRDTGNGFEILVEDNGPGFQPADDDEPHLALANITERLQLMCRGELSISAGTSGGTAVRLFIPENERE